MKHAIHIISISEAQVTYGEERLTIKGSLHQFLNIILHGFQSRAAYNQVNTPWYTCLWVLYGL